MEVKNSINKMYHELSFPISCAIDDNAHNESYCETQFKIDQNCSDSVIFPTYDAIEQLTDR